MSAKNEKPELVSTTFTKNSTGYTITAKMRSADKSTAVSYSSKGLSLKPSTIRLVRDEALSGALDALLALTEES